MAPAVVVVVVVDVVDAPSVVVTCPGPDDVVGVGEGVRDRGGGVDVDVGVVAVVAAAAVDVAGAVVAAGPPSADQAGRRNPVEEAYVVIGDGPFSATDSIRQGNVVCKKKGGVKKNKIMPEVVPKNKKMSDRWEKLLMQKKINKSKNSLSCQLFLIVRWNRSK